MATAVQITMDRVFALMLPPPQARVDECRTRTRGGGGAIRAAARRIPRSRIARIDPARVLAPARLEHQLDRGLAHVQVEALAHVRDVDDVAPGLGDAA